MARLRRLALGFGRMAAAMAVLLVAACASPEGGPPPLSGDPSAPARPKVADSEIRAEVLRRWGATDGDIARRIDLSVQGGRVLLTGRAKDADQRVEAVRLAWQALGVTEVINEVEIGDTSSLSDQATDVWIATQLRSKLLLDSGVASRNYSIDVVNQTVYVMGRSARPAELERVLDHARGIARVRRVVSHVVQ